MIDKMVVLINEIIGFDYIKIMIIRI